jgi:hypothetical protein
MRKLISILVLSLAAAPAFALPNVVPEPEVLTLLVIGVVGLALSRAKK